jgi:PAS domain S-box-containing protein
MPEHSETLPDETAALKERVRKLALDKSYLQLIINLMNKVSSAQGLDSLVESLLKNILDVIGGTNIILYYLKDGELMFADLMGSHWRVERVDDEQVQRVFECRTPVEIEHGFDNTQMLTQEFSKGYSWIFPLIAGQELIGVIKLENLHMGMRELYGALPVFFSYVAMVLKNEISDNSQLMQAYDELRSLNEELELEIGEREQLENELRQARDELEERVEQRTAELLSVNRQAEEQEHLLSAIVQSSDDAIISKDLNGIILSWNSGAEQLYGYSAVEAVGRDVAMLVPPDHSRELTEIMTNIRQGKKVEHYTTERIRKDGTRICVSLTVSPIRDAAGHVMGASSIAHDVTSRMQAEEALKQSEERLKEAQRIAHFGSWELDLTNDKLLWSDEIYRIFEIDPAQFGASYEAFLDRIHPDDRAMVNAAYTNSVKNRTPYSIEHRLLFADGRVKYVHEQCETFYDAGGRALRSVGTVQDVSELKGVEAAVRELNAGLEKRVSDRTLELRESQQALMNIVEDLNLKTTELEEANAKLQDLDRLKSMFIASMSHELRTPLNSIIGFSSIIRDEWLGPVNPEQKENLETIQRSGKHLLSLINDVIDVSKIEAGRIEIRFEEFDLYDLVTEAIQYVEKDIRDKGLELNQEIAHRPLCTDRRRLLQCVINLLSNAVKFTERGGISVRATVVDEAAGGEPGRCPMVSISVSDSGIGISQEDIPKLFEAFVRLDSPLKTLVPGTGLGLYLTKKLVVDVMKGDIGCQSEEGVGSTFTLRIPEKIHDAGVDAVPVVKASNDAIV